jgi:hypothetical protein
MDPAHGLWKRSGQISDGASGQPNDTLGRCAIALGIGKRRSEAQAPEKSNSGAGLLLEIGFGPHVSGRDKGARVRHPAYPFTSGTLSAMGAGFGGVAQSHRENPGEHGIVQPC